MNENILVSIIIASYNYEKFISEAIESVLAQTYSNFELIIVDDGSKDDSVALINSYVIKDSRIKLYCHDKNANKGLKETLTLGISKCNGNYIAFLESDDIWTSDYLQDKIDIIKKYPGSKVIFNDVELFGNKDRIDDYTDYFKKNNKILNSKKYPCNLFNVFSFQNVIPTFSSAMASSELLKNSDFNSSVPAFIDHWMWAHLAAKNDFYYINKKLTLWRMHKSSYIGKNSSKNEKRFMYDLLQALKSLKLSYFKMFFWNRHQNPKIEKIFRGFFRNFI